ncbi:MAG: SDR family oxidoreductase [Deltaproteobacteria bacterium]|nr:MAG: SDR family oxidoreductase [Deltaproteobacteria bacterium]
MSSRNSAPALPDLEGRTVVITGANTGIGRTTALALARAGAQIVLAGRSRERTQPVIDAIGDDKAHFVPLDLASLDSVREGAQGILALDRPIHVLINNAGLAGTRGQTRDGFELAFGVNHLGHFLLTHLLLDRILASDGARIVHVASKAHHRARRPSFDALRETTRTRTAWPEYCVSKLANVLFNAALHRRLEGSGVVTHALHPGVVASDIWRNVPAPLDRLIKLFMISDEEGAATTLHCATSPEAGERSGLYWVRCRTAPTSRLARDEALQEEMWRRSAEWCAIDWA